MGINYTYDSPCWSLYAFDSAADREAWLAENEYSNGNLVAEAVSVDVARKICPWLRKNNPHDNQTGYYTYNHGREVVHL